MDQIVKTQLGRLVAAYPTANVDEQMLNVWMNKMRKYPPSVLTKTVDVLIDSCKFFPSLAEFSEFAQSERTKETLARQSEVRRDCQDCFSGWIDDHFEKDGKRVEAFRPCPTCLPDGYEKWKAGEYASTYRNADV
jgi:hypothetical protein